MKSCFGDGSDGNFAVRSGEVVELHRNMYYNNLTVRRGGKLKINGYRIFVKGTLIIKGLTKVAKRLKIGTASSD